MATRKPEPTNESKQREGGSEFERLLEYLKLNRGFDFTAYKRSSLQRRVQKRMSQVNVEGYEEYLDYLEVHQDEFQHLFNTILINVTSFFRDQEAWDYLSENVIPAILESKMPDQHIRIWVAGCASGEEAYSMAMLLGEAMGVSAFRERVKVYATDLDDDALSKSRYASYSEREIQSVPEAFLKKYFERNNDRYYFDRELRRSVIFGRHDLIQDAPISRVDMLLCRNTLMYFNAETQERILSRFHFALTEGGYLFLGKAETLLTHTNLFAPIDLKNRVFTRVQRSRVRDRSYLFSPSNSDIQRIEINPAGKLRDAALESSPAAQMVLDVGGRMMVANARAREMFGLTARDIGRPIQDLEVSYRPVELRSGIDQAVGQRRVLTHKDVSWSSSSGDPTSLDINILPLTGESGEIIGTSITFEDVTHFKRLQGELMNINQELETAYEEVQSTNEELQTTNEELQSTVEELETTNEELQSTNEELETMNEELQSANEELETINEELRLRSRDLNRANLFLETILAGLRDGVIVLDADLHILAWNVQSEDLWGLRSDEVLGKHFLNLDIGLPVEQLRIAIRTCLSTLEPQQLSLEAVNRRGRKVVCQTLVTPLQGGATEQKGVILLSSCAAAT
ncbi:MAG TPA: CheR family methyltransferase [Fimbriimonas sp.]|nr:CheR family methyltransferase [Fimbriimonas sp.]